MNALPIQDDGKLVQIGIAGIACITWLDTVAMIFLRIDGNVLLGSCAGIGLIVAGLAGYKAVKG